MEGAGRAGLLPRALPACGCEFAGDPSGDAVCVCGGGVCVGVCVCERESETM